MIKKFKDMNPGDYFNYNNDAYIKIGIWNMEANKWEHKAICLTSAKNFIEFNLDRKFDVFASNFNYRSKENYLN